MLAPVKINSNLTEFNIWKCCAKKTNNTKKFAKQNSICATCWSTEKMWKIPCCCVRTKAQTVSMPHLSLSVSLVSLSLSLALLSTEQLEKMQPRRVRIKGEADCENFRSPCEATKKKIADENILKKFLLCHKNRSLSAAWEFFVKSFVCPSSFCIFRSCRRKNLKFLAIIFNETTWYFRNSFLNIETPHQYLPAEGLGINVRIDA